MKATIQDVAKKANVSIATVSRILNGQVGYSEETKEKVLLAIKELGYRRNSIARGLVTKKSNIIGVLLPDVSTTFSAEILRGIEDYAHESGYSVVICNTGVDGVRVKEYIETLESRQIDGIINISINMKDDECQLLKDYHIPCVFISMLNYKYQFPYVKVDDLQAAACATQYLIDKGHKRIAMISGSEDDYVAGGPRLMGYKQALMANQIPIDSQLIKIAGFGFEDGVSATQELLKEEDFTAIFAVSDHVAVGAIQVIHAMGKKVPDDISVIGYDNTAIAEMCNPPLTSLAQPLYEMGMASVQKILKVIEEKVVVSSEVFNHSIVERKTVREI